MTFNELQSMKNSQNDYLTSLITVSTSSKVTESLLINNLIPATTSVIQSFSIDTMLSEKTLTLSNQILTNTLNSAIELSVDVNDVITYGPAVSSILLFATSISSSSSSSSSIVSSNSSSSNSSTSSSSSSSSTSLVKLQAVYETYVDSIVLLGSAKTSNKTTLQVTDNFAVTISRIATDNVITSLGRTPPHRILFTKSTSLRRLDSSSSSSSSSSDGDGSSSAYLRRLGGGSSSSSSSSSSATLGLSVTRASLYSTGDSICTNCTLNDKDKNIVASNPLRVSLNCSSIGQASTIIMIQNYANQGYQELVSNNTYETTCLINRPMLHHYKCHYDDSNSYDIDVTCDGSSNVTYVSNCPTRRVTPTCDIVTTSDYGGQCTLLTYNTTSITCSCSLCSSSSLSSSSSSSSSHRHLMMKKTSSLITYRIASVTKYIIDDYYTTMVSSRTTTTTDLANTITVIVSFITVWVTIIIITAYHSLTNISKKKKIKNSDSSTSSSSGGDGDDSTSYDNSNKDLDSSSSNSSSSRSSWLATTTTMISKILNNSSSSSSNDSSSSSIQYPDDTDGLKRQFKDYLLSYFPKILKNDDSNSLQLFKEVISYHQYFSLISNSNRNNVGSNNIYVHAFHLGKPLTHNLNPYP